MNKTFKVSLPEAALAVGTRAIAGVGIGLLLGNHLIASERRRLGWALFAFGALTTVPLAMRIVPRIRRM